MDLNDALKLVADARAAHPPTDALYQTVDARSSINIDVSTEATWGSETTALGTTISVAPTAHPSESLMHELLHADFKLQGYRQHLTMFRVDGNDMVQYVVQALDNELQHHRTFPTFVAAGLDPTKYYCDEDRQTYKRVRTELKRMKPKTLSAGYLFLNYLSAIAPGGAGSEAERAQLKRFFHLVAPREQMQKVEAAAEMLLAWGRSTSLDPGPVIRDILEALGFGGWWIGASQHFPKDGHFVGTPFTIQDAERYVDR